MGIGIEQVVSANIILVHGFLNEAHSQSAAIKSQILRGECGNGGDMMDADQLSIHKRKMGTL